MGRDARALEMGEKKPIPNESGMGVSARWASHQSPCGLYAGMVSIEKKIALGNLRTGRRIAKPQNPDGHKASRPEPEGDSRRNDPRIRTATDVTSRGERVIPPHRKKFDSGDDRTRSSMLGLAMMGGWARAAGVGERIGGDDVSLPCRGFALAWGGVASRRNRSLTVAARIRRPVAPQRSRARPAV